MTGASMVPQEIWICGHRHRVELDRRWPSSTWGFHGCIDYAAGLVRLNAACNEDYLREVLLHEVLHGIDKAMSDDGGELARMLAGEGKRRRDENGCALKEAEVLMLSRALWWTLTDPRNRAAVDWMLGRL